LNAKKMHAEEVDIDLPLVRRLIAAQFPHWANLPIQQVESSGTDNALFRLGDGFAIRLPRVVWTVSQVEKEQRWLPFLAPHLPLAIPVPLGKGVPGEGYPWLWSVYGWLEGENPSAQNLSDFDQAARDLAHFLIALQQINPAGGPLPAEANTTRGLPLAARDAEVRQAIAALQGKLDGDLATAAWEASLYAPAWLDPPRWIHGDMQPGNLLATGGRLSAVIDFGCLTLGDPACDLMVAWNLLTAESRQLFRVEAGLDDAAWLRGRGWALSQALIFIPYYLETNPAGVAQAWRVVAEVLADHERNS
jgi:aminoglycoside phosphotransferase (APT) family kinase protein